MQARFTVVYDKLPTIELLRHEETKRGDIFTLLTPIQYDGFVIPEGFESDGASVPRILWPVVFPADDLQAMYGAIVHDFLYRTHPKGWDKAQADETFQFLMEKGGVPKRRARLAYIGVKLFGGPSWRAGGKQ